MRIVDLIEKKKLGLELSSNEIEFIIKGFVSGQIPDYQISALLMAILFKKLNENEIYELTYQMLKSGDEIDLSEIDGICVDKHSTGGVGDKTTLVIAPILASFGLKLAKMSGRGLGHTGGTLDKLESIPNFQISCTKEDFMKQVNEIGLSVVGQTANIAPADKKLYALRDVTSTVDSIGLIVSSVMSKKLASGAKIILLDVKVGDGAFMKTLEDARELAKELVKVGKRFDRSVVAMMTNMDEPLGYAIGNSLEVIEAIETLKGNGPKDFTQLCYEICTQMIKKANLYTDDKQIKELIKEKITSKEALNKLKEMIKYQHGDERVIDDYSVFEKAKEVIDVYALDEGYVQTIDTKDLGVSAMLLGAGREKANEEVDHSVGLLFYPKKGDYIKKGDLICKVHTNGKNTEKAIEMVHNALKLTKEKTINNNIVLDIIGD